MTDVTLGLSPLTGEPYRPTECRRPITLAAYTADRQTGELAPSGTVTTRCGSWSCAGCGRRLKALHSRLVRIGIAHHQERGRLARFVTITFPTDVGAMLDNPTDVARCSALVTRFIGEIRRTHAPRAEYYAAKESTKRGRLHVHLVIAGPYLRKCRHRPGDPKRDAAGVWLNPCLGPHGCAGRDRPCIQSIAHRLGLGWVDVRRVNSANHAAAYIAKYLTKHTGADWPRYSRRASYSLGRLTCATHPENDAGRRCCPDAARAHYFAPNTIGNLGRVWSDLAYTAGIGAGVIDPDAPRVTGDVWRFANDPAHAPPPTPPPNHQVAEAVILARLNRRLAAYRDAAGLGISEPVPPAIVTALTAPTIRPIPGLLALT